VLTMLMIINAVVWILRRRIEEPDSW